MPPDLREVDEGDHPPTPVREDQFDAPLQGGDSIIRSAFLTSTASIGYLP